MEKYFYGTRHFDCTVFVADYTQYAQEYHERRGIGVVISVEKPELINSLVFNNPNNVNYWGVNFEKNGAVFKLENGEKVSNCECMFVSEQGNQKRWMVLVELKYCKGENRNIASNYSDALSQLKDTFVYLCDEKHLFERDSFRNYWIISMPELNDKIPFSAFLFSQDELTDYKDKYNSIIISDNEVNIWTGSVIKRPVYD